MDKGLTVPKWVLIVWSKIPQMPQNLSAQFVCLSPKVLNFNEKKLHWASVVNRFGHSDNIGSSYLFLQCKQSLCNSPLIQRFLRIFNLKGLTYKISIQLGTVHNQRRLIFLTLGSLTHQATQLIFRLCVSHSLIFCRCLSCCSHLVQFQLKTT